MVHTDPNVLNVTAATSVPAIDTTLSSFSGYVSSGAYHVYKIAVNASQQLVVTVTENTGKIAGISLQVYSSFKAKKLLVFRILFKIFNFWAERLMPIRSADPVLYIWDIDLLF
jgi:hypothetical protein